MANREFGVYGAGVSAGAHHPRVGGPPIASSHITPTILSHGATYRVVVGPEDGLVADMISLKPITTSLTYTVDRDVIVARDARQRLRLLPKVDVIQIGDRTERFRFRCAEDPDDLAGTLDRQRPQQQGIGQAERGSGGADAHGHREYRNRGKTGVSGKDAKAVTEVLQ